MFEQQINRIIDKLDEARRIDRKFKVFGADSHKYKIGPQLNLDEISDFENKYLIKLPECYKAFLLKIGNGGTSFNASAAGPFYGIYPLGTGVGELLDDPEQYLKLPAKIKPDMSDEEWKSLTHTLDDEEIADDIYDAKLGEIYSGVLPIGFQRL